MEVSKLRELMRNVPFGNSVYQISHFTEHETPERQYRHCLLQIDCKLKALKECEYRRRRLDIDIQELKEKLIESEGLNKARLEIDIEEKEYNLEVEKKLIEDAVIELTVYEQELSKLPEYTREQFEESEEKYWRQRLLNDAKREQLSTGSVSVGTLSSLESTGLIFGRDSQGQIAYVEESQKDLSSPKIHSIRKD